MNKDIVTKNLYFEIKIPLITENYTHEKNLNIR
jgi:hypothetical protein